MNTPDDLKFLEDFPMLSEWLMLNGFSLIHSGTSPEMNITASVWSDRCAEDKTFCPAQDDPNDLLLLYCDYCKTIEVYGSGFVGLDGNDREITETLKKHVKNTVTDRIARILEE